MRGMCPFGTKKGIPVGLKVTPNAGTAEVSTECLGEELLAVTGK
jgi:hypothetical protein